ncbi:nuclear transcription factor Y subunit beta-like [Eupeodes corollae]|uniref:nuclear transcription factor Y subunit beta-like n=1 Tax=Eupeodes corollae TaxID=290404 RepID=UPI0024939FF8|nr:nuclear transcription factor Y subunit beta-like [Eupeodes corollae]
MEKERKAGLSKDTSANSSGDANVVPSAVHKFTATSSGHQSDSQLNVKRKLKPNLVERNNAAKRGAMRQGVQQKKQQEMTSQSESSDGDIDYVSEGGEGHYRSPTNKNKNRFSSLASPEQPKEREMEVPEAPNDNEAGEVELAQVLQAKKQQIDAYEDQLKKLKEEMEPLLSALKAKIEARRQKEAAEKEEKQQQPKPATKITGAEQKMKALPAVTGPMNEGPSTSSKAKQQQQQELQARQQQQQKQKQHQVHRKIAQGTTNLLFNSSGHFSRNKGIEMVCDVCGDELV